MPGSTVAVRGMRTALRALRLSVLLVMLTAAGSMLLVDAISYSDILRIRHEITGSMEPMIHVDDLVVYQPTRGADLRAGDVIGFHRRGEPTEVTHRITAVTVAGPGVTVSTKGDANPSPDQDRVIFQADTIVWRVWYVAPRVGRPLRQLSGTNGVPFALGMITLFLTLPWIERQFPDPGRAIRRTGRHRRPAHLPPPSCLTRDRAASSRPRRRRAMA